MEFDQEKAIEILSNSKDEIEIAEDIILSNDRIIIKMAAIIRDGRREKKTDEDIYKNLLLLLEDPNINVNEKAMKVVINSYSSRRLCVKGVLTPDQFDIITDTRMSKIRYRRIHKLYISLCKLCNLDRVDIESFLDKALFLVKNLHNIRCEESPIMRDALTLMFCKSGKKCINQSSQMASTLDKSFLNWMSHMAASLANEIIMIGDGTDEASKWHLPRYNDQQEEKNDDDDPEKKLKKLNKGISSIRGRNLEEVEIGVGDKLTERLKTLSRSNLTLVSKLYEIDSDFRIIRSPKEDTEGICGEKLDDNHERQINIATSIQSLADVILNEKAEELEEL